MDYGVRGWWGAREALPRLSLQEGRGVEGGDAGVGLSGTRRRPRTCELLCICTSLSDLLLLITYNRLRSKNADFWGQDFGRTEPQV